MPPMKNEDEDGPLQAHEYLAVCCGVLIVLGIGFYAILAAVIAFVLSLDD